MFIKVLLPLVLLIVFGLTGLIIYQTGYKAGREFERLVGTNIQTITPISKGNCKYGVLSRDEFLNTYIVKKGDTILSIASQELGDVSRVNEIVLLNQDAYSSLSLSNPFIEVGWLLYLPSKQLPRFSTKLEAYQGRVKESTDIKWSLDIYNNQPDEIAGGYLAIKTKDTVYLGKNSFEKNDCIKVIQETGGSTNVIAISLQDKNYFK